MRVSPSPSVLWRLPKASPASKEQAMKSGFSTGAPITWMAMLERSARGAFPVTIMVIIGDNQCPFIDP